MDMFEQAEVRETDRLQKKVERYAFVEEEMRKLGLAPTMKVMDGEESGDEVK